MFITSVSNTECEEKKMQLFFWGIHFIEFLANIWSNGEKISWMLESACKICKASLTVCIDDYRLSHVRLLWTIQSGVTLLTAIQSPTPYYEIKHSSTHNSMTQFPYWYTKCNYTQRCDYIHNCGVHQYARPVMNGRGCEF